MTRHAGWSAALTMVGGLSVAHADATNRNLLPIGEAESLRSNAGIAGASPGSVFHNPAALARIDHPQLAVSGTTLMYFQSKTDRLIQLDEAVSYEASGFAPIPSSLVSTYKLGDFALATAILVPDMFQLDNRQRRDTAAARINISQSVRRQDLWLGVGVARALGEGQRVAIGASVFGVRRTSISNTFFQITVPAMEGVFAQTTSNETTSITGLAAILGVSIEATPWLTVGLRIEPPFLQLASTASIFRSQISGDGMATQVVEIDKEQVEIDQPVPPDFGLGLAIRPAKNVTIYLDAAVQLAADYTFVDDPDLGPPDRVELTTAPRGSVGLDVQPWKKLMLHGGVHYNRGAQRRLEAGGDSVEDFFGATIGATVLGKRSRTGVGLFMQRSTAEIVPLNAMPGDTEEATTTVIGALITVGYLL